MVCSSIVGVEGFLGKLQEKHFSGNAVGKSNIIIAELISDLRIRADANAVFI